MKVYEYKDYDEYVEIQTEANKEKLGWFFVTPRVIKAILEDNPMVGSVLCHGTRGGAEQYEFQKHLPHAYVIGTEISEHCRDVPMTVQWDMQVPKEEWIGKFDIVYSNSFDHCIWPDKTMVTWAHQLSQHGALYLEYSEQQSTGSAHDPLDATLEEVIQLMQDAGLKVKDLATRGKSNSIILRGKKS